jgi:hypothetical protein
LDHVTTIKLSDPLEKFTDWERFQYLVYNLISLRIGINSGVEADKAVLEFIASIASAYRLLTSKIKLSELNCDIPGFDMLLKHKKRFRKLWCEVTLQSIWPIAKLLTNRDGPMAPTAPTTIHGPFGIKLHLLERARANTIADFLEKQFTPHDLCEENHKLQVEARVQDLLQAVDIDPPKRIRPCDLQKLIESLKLRKACGIDGIPNECLRQLPKTTGASNKSV